ncbi:MAG TPA: glycosyltransferase [Anaerolineaceae bacterium]|nr:glycosyltransferase [Anaerolineaceae bacterium]
MKNIEKVAYFSYSPYRLAWEQIRVVSPLQTLGIDLIEGVNQGQVNLDVIEHADLVILDRNFPGGFNQSLKVIDVAHEQHKPIIMDMDDDLLGLEFDHPDLINTSFGFELVPALYALRAVDAVTVTTPQLKSVIAQHNDHVYVLPNYLDDTVWSMKSKEQPESDSPVTLLYFGTRSHKSDLEMISEPLKAMAQKFSEKVSFVFYGVAAPEGLDSVADVRYIPTVTHEYLEFARNIRKFDADIAFAPLRDTVFNHNKSPLKYFEYTALGLPCVFSKIPPYKGVVEDGQTGFLASSSEEWFDKLTRLIEDPVLRKTTLEHAQEDVNKNHLLSKHTDDWGKVYSEVHERGVVSKSERAINLDLLNRLSRHVGVAANFQAHQVEEMNNALHSSEEARITQGAEIEALKVALHNSQLEVVDYATSTSWKITRPIRRVLRKLRRR